MGYRLNGLDEPVLMAGPKPMPTEFSIHQRSESCVLEQEHTRFLAPRTISIFRSTGLVQSLAVLLLALCIRCCSKLQNRPGRKHPDPRGNTHWLRLRTRPKSLPSPNKHNSAVVWRKVLLVFFMIFELGPYLESLWNGLPSEPIRCGVKEFFHHKNWLWSVWHKKGEKSLRCLNFDLGEKS